MESAGDLYGRAHIKNDLWILICILQKIRTWLYICILTFWEESFHAYLDECPGWKNVEYVSFIAQFLMSIIPDFITK